MHVFINGILESNSPNYHIPEGLMYEGLHTLRLLGTLLYLFSEKDEENSGHLRGKIGIIGNWLKYSKNRDNPDFIGTVGNSG